MEENKDKYIKVDTHIGEIKVDNSQSPTVITFADKEQNYTFNILKEYITQASNNLTGMLNGLCQVSSNILHIIESIPLILNKIKDVSCKVNTHSIRNEHGVDDRIIFIEFDSPSKAGMIFIYDGSRHKFIEIFSFDRDNIGLSQHRQQEYIPHVHGVNPRFEEILPIVSFNNMYTPSGLNTYIDEHFQGVSSILTTHILYSVLDRYVQKDEPEIIQQYLNAFLNKFKIPDVIKESAELRIDTNHASFSNIKLSVYSGLINISLDEHTNVVSDDRARYMRRSELYKNETTEKNVPQGFTRLKPKTHNLTPLKNELVFNESTADVRYRVTISVDKTVDCAGVKEIMSAVESVTDCCVYESSRYNKYILFIKKKEMALSLVFINKILETLDADAVKVKIEKVGGGI